MLLNNLVNPEVIGAVARCGHKDMILISAGNFSLQTRANPDAKHIYLSLTKGMPTSTEILDAILSVCPVEAATVIGDGTTCEAHEDYTKSLGGMELNVVSPDEFYALAGEKVVQVAIQSGDYRPFSNILLQVGCSR